MFSSERPTLTYRLTEKIRYLLNPRARPRRRRSVFVVGCGHSGTTLLLRVLGSHPSFQAVLRETEVFLKPGTKEELDKLEGAAEACGKRLVEKTPAHIRCIGQILKIRPNARVLIMLRDGRDVAVSVRKRKGNLLLGATRWREDNIAGQRWWNDHRVRVVRYERLVSAFEQEVAGIMDFLGETYTDEVKLFHRKFADERAVTAPPEDSSEKNHVAYRMWQVSQPLFDGRGRWVKDLTAEERAIFKREAGALLREYGYADSDDW